MDRDTEDRCTRGKKWATMAQDRKLWSAMEATFVAKVLRSTPKPQLPRTRWMMHEEAHTTGVN